MRIVELAPRNDGAASRGWLLAGSGSCYLLADAGDRVVQRYWGPALSAGDARRMLAEPQVPSSGRSPRAGEGAAYDTHLTWGGLAYCEHALHLSYADGHRYADWRTEPGELVDDGMHLVVTLTDAGRGVNLELHVRVHADSDVIERWPVLRNDGDETVRIRRAFSGTFVAPEWGNYRRSHGHGAWGSEGMLERHELPYGTSVDRSREGTRSLGPNPWVMLDDATATEEHGAVCGVALAWSGSFALVSERTAGGMARLTGGIDDTDLVIELGPGEVYGTPVLAGLYTRGGFGAASRAWHAYARAHVLPRSSPRPVLYNSWEATGFDLDEQGQLRLAELAAEIGCELLVMDDGWFGARDSDRAGLGDWTVNARKFPRGLGPLIDGVRGYGMRFGIWVEPEMVNPDSDLYRSHPDWVVQFPGVPATEARNQLVLNFGRDDVREWAYKWLHRLLADHHITFVKWDCNRGLSEPGWPGRGNPERLWIEHVRGVYTLLDRLRAAHPDVEFESCASGGGRVDYGMLRRCEQFWASDNTDAVDRLAIQDGCSQLYPAKAMGAWVTDVPNYLTGRTVPLGYRFVVAMAGVLAVGGDLAQWGAEERRVAARWVELYKQVRDTVQDGSLYRLARLADHGLSAVQYVGADGGHVVVLAAGLGRGTGCRTQTVRPRCLDADTTYRVETYDGAGDGSGMDIAERTGASLAASGLAVPAAGDYPSACAVLTRL